MPSPAHRVALVTGAAKRIGAEIVRQLHKEDFNLVIHYHQSGKAAKALADELNHKRENSALCISADLNNVAQVVNLAEQAQQYWQRMDLLVNNASSFHPTPIGESSENDWDRLINSNLKAPFFLAQALAEKLALYHGCIINIADIYADRPLKKHSIYSIAKAGNVMLTKTLAQELAPLVRVNGIAPGAILWPDEHENISDKLSEDQKANMLAKIPLHRRGEPQDIAQTILFLIRSHYITGQILSVDGGRSLTI